MFWQVVNADKMSLVDIECGIVILTSEYWNKLNMLTV
jgi:hypothetical protein